MRKTLVNQSVSSTVMTFILLITGLVAITAPAQAATPKPKPVIVKQGTACTKTGAKTTSNRVVYTCGTNPATTSTKLVWIRSNCLSAQGAYLSAMDQFTKYETASAQVMTQLQTTLASYQNALTVAQATQADMATKVYVITRERTNRDGTIKPSLTAVGVTAAIAAMQGKITEDQTALANAKTELAAAKDAASRLSWNKAISALEAAIKSWPSRIDLLNSAVTKIASAITMDQEQIALRTQKIKDAQTSQSELITRLQNTIATTKKTRALSCKVGL